ncbi:MAG TPA: hypothetical protein VH599_11760 [Ktedonobacterales bacterium]|jgi:hypothetical protein
MLFEDPRNALSVARTHQRELLEREQRDRLGEQARRVSAGPGSPRLASRWQRVRAVGQWLLARIARRTAVPL